MFPRLTFHFFLPRPLILDNRERDRDGGRETERERVCVSVCQTEAGRGLDSCFQLANMQASVYTSLPCIKPVEKVKSVGRRIPISTTPHATHYGVVSVCHPVRAPVPRDHSMLNFSIGCGCRARSASVCRSVPVSTCRSCPCAVHVPFMSMCGPRAARVHAVRDTRRHNIGKV